MDILNNVYWGNTVTAYLIAAGSIIVAWAVLKLLRHKVIAGIKKRTQSTATQTDDILIKTIQDYLLPFGYLWINYIIINQLNLHPKFDRILSAALMVITTYYGVRLINYLVCGVLTIYMERKNEPQERIRQLNGILMVVKAIVWVMGIIMLIDNLGYNVRTIIAGLGVGGIAIALAAQNILGDLFSYLVIFFDKPFEVGDFIIVGAHAGIVEKIGIKTSHVRSLDGQQLVMPNAEMVKTVIQNYKRLQRRRMVFTISVSYLTPAHTLKEIPGIIKEIVDKYEMVTFDRAHLKTFSEHSITYEIVYYINSAEFPVFMNSHQSVSIDILEAFEKRGIRFALPTTVIRQADGNGKLFAQEQLVNQS
ncbi:mechanosensitive ion channel family protein [Terrimonas sp. NA20]|uniref:Mechanosensitive ion channel family protein n=1 Tax=Terrimonas ginsenosidimutans TaxID=2908004 RepID=A0ABS9KLK8_9BACT|nr:mechanosensitive ion channel family protein [Terrimonas ginsenosidimutans]MCG2613212.1 mechanosensitive ion channel family protein [Terrimonas ginsenosidimutans]